MPIIKPADLETNLYAEIINEITRGDDAITQRAISAAVQETKQYLARYDLLQLFGDENTDPTIQDEYLKLLVKNIACWHLLSLSPNGIDETSFRRAYEDALSGLRAIMNGQAQPEGWPYKDTSENSTPTGDSISWSSNAKRSNYF